MFTGIIEEIGAIKSIQISGDTAVMTIRAVKVLLGLKLGDSLAVNGVCLTVREQTGQDFRVEISAETLERSNLGELNAGSEVNLERPLTPASRLGGHFVQGHVDGVGRVLSSESRNGFGVWEFSLPTGLKPYVVEKGSIAVNGISLTVAKLREQSFEVGLVPHTLENTNLRNYIVGGAVNLEVDVLAKYVESLLNKRADAKKSVLTEDYLREQGY